jgi:hypothetical protein
LEVEAFVFADLAAVRGPSALGAMATFLRRCEELESAPARKATRKEDKAALATLEERGLTKALRDDLQAKLALATLEGSADGGDPGARAVSPEALARRQHQLALYRWLPTRTTMRPIENTEKRSLARSPHASDVHHRRPDLGGAGHQHPPSEPSAAVLAYSPRVYS